MSEQQQPVPSTYPEPRVRVYGDLVEKVEKLRADKRLRFYDVVFAYAFGEGSKPVFDDPELAELWQQTDVRPYTPGRRGYIKLSQRGGRDGKEQK